MIKHLFILLFITALFYSCDKTYYCVCETTTTRQDTTVDYVKTTKLGSRGYKKTCEEYAQKIKTVKECKVK